MQRLQPHPSPPQLFRFPVSRKRAWIMRDKVEVIRERTSSNGSDQYLRQTPQRGHQHGRSPGPRFRGHHFCHGRALQPRATGGFGMAGVVVGLETGSSFTFQSSVVIAFRRRPTVLPWHRHFVAIRRRPGNRIDCAWPRPPPAHRAHASPILSKPE